jgi:enolase
MKILAIHAREILDSRGNPTVEVDVRVEGGFGRAAVPSGASTGEREALELRDGDKSRYQGKGVRTAVANVNGEIAKALIGTDLDQRALDEKMIALDGTAAKSRLGANALLGVSMAAVKATASALGRPVYAHIAELAGRSAWRVHAARPDDEHPQRRRARRQQRRSAGVHGHACRNADLRGGVAGRCRNLSHAARDLKKAGHSTGVGDEGGFAPNLRSNREALDVVLEAIAKAGYSAGENVFLALDVASSELWENGKYVFGSRVNRHGHRRND